MTENPEKRSACKCKDSGSTNSGQVLADVVLRSLRPALRDFLGRHNQAGNPWTGFLEACSGAVLAELANRDGAKHDRP